MGTSFIVGKIRIKLWLLARAISRDLDLKGRQERRAVKLSLRFIYFDREQEREALTQLFHLLIHPPHGCNAPSQEPGAALGFLGWVVGVQVLEALSAAFPGMLAHS